MTTILKVNVAG